MEEKVWFKSDGLKLCGVLNTPPGLKPGERRPAFINLHGFGTSKDAKSMLWPGRTLADWGYVTLRFDFRGLNESEGERGRVICLEQVEDVKNAVSFMRSLPQVDPDRIGLIGHSFGAAVAVYAGGVDERVGAVISCCGWGDGMRKFKAQHPGEEAWARFSELVEKARRAREQGGEPLMISRWDIVPIPEHLRVNLVKTAVMEFPIETVESMLNFVADDVVANIAPRPLLLLHAAADTVTPTQESVELFRRAGSNAELILLTEVDHFMFCDDSPRVINIVRDWLQAKFPLPAMLEA